MMNTNWDMLGIMRGHLDRLYADMDTLDAKARWVLVVGLGLLLVAVVLLLSAGQTLVVILLLVVTGGLFAGMVYLAVRTLTPTTYSFPVDVDWDNIQTYLAMEDERYINQLLSDSIDVFWNNQAVTKRKSKHVKWLLRGVLAAAVVLVLALGAAVLSGGVGESSDGPLPAPAVTVTPSPVPSSTPALTATLAATVGATEAVPLPEHPTPTPEAAGCTGRVLVDGLNVHPVPGVSSGVMFSVGSGVTFAVWDRVKRDGYEWLDVTIQDGEHAGRQGWLAAGTVDGSRRFVGVGEACE